VTARSINPCTECGAPAPAIRGEKLGDTTFCADDHETRYYRRLAETDPSVRTCCGTHIDHWCRCPSIYEPDEWAEWASTLP